MEYVSFQQIVYEVNEWHCPPIPKACDGQGADYLNTSAIYVRYPLLTTLISFPSFSIFLHTSPLCHLFPYHPIALSHPLRMLFFLLSMLPSLPLPHSLTHPLPLPLLPLPVLFIVFIYLFFGSNAASVMFDNITVWHTGTTAIWLANNVTGI